MMSLTVMRAIMVALEAGRRGVVATVLTHRGSAPGRAFHKMLYLAGGETVGTIGGGALEKQVIDECVDVLASGQGRTITWNITERGERATGGVCGGQVEIALEVLPRVPRLLICGGGHCGLALARLCDQLDYLYEVHEDRDAFSEEDRFPGAAAVHCGDPDRLVETVGEIERFSHVLLVSRGHITDRLYARSLARAQYAGWIGMLGSKNKWRIISKTWREEDKLDDAFIESITSPVGLPIGASSPAEIAVSIMAQIIQLAASDPPS